MDDRFALRVYNTVRKIPRGSVMTYSQVAMLSGSPRAARAVGNILHKNPFEGDVPCHRVVNCKGGLACGFAFGGEGEQMRRLKAENVGFLPDGTVDMKKYCAK